MDLPQDEKRSQVINQYGRDITQQFVEGAKKTLQVALETNVKLAILTDGSPSCGSTYIYDGTFTGKRIDGMGVTAALLEKNGVRVFSQKEIELADRYLNALIKYAIAT